VSNQQTIGSPEPRPSNLTLFLRLTRAQFLPLIILPALVGTAYAYHVSARFDSVLFALVLLGVISLHLGANAIDDAYDFQNGVDSIANSMFPPDFGGWKPIPRGYVSLRSGKIVSIALLVVGLAVGVFFWYAVGVFAFLLALAGTLLAIFYCAPPAKLDYRGLGLGELAIFFTFGPLPVMGAYYVQTGQISLDALLVSLPIGITTVTILMDHDMIFYEVYSKSRKLSLTTVLGKKYALYVSACLSMLSYFLVVVLVATRILPSVVLAAPIISVFILFRKWKVFTKHDAPPPFYVPFTVNALYADWVLSLCLALALLF
jgi:1,4-dihydroxy-2-naphthoate polyprenyltransferase